MMITPESMIAIPEFEGPWPNSSAEYLLYIERTFDPNTHVTAAKLCLLHVKHDSVRVLHEGSQIQTAFWGEGSNYIVMLESAETEKNVIVSILDTSDTSANFTTVGTLPVGASGLASVAVSNQKLILAFSALATVNDQIHDLHHAAHFSSGREYTTMPVRTNNSWITSEKLTVFCTTLDLSGNSPQIGELFNTLSATDQEYKLYGGIHLTMNGIAVVAGAHRPTISEIPLTTVYFIPMTALLSHDLSARKRLRTPGLNGFSNSPYISKGGEKLIYLQKRKSWLEDDPSLLVICEGLNRQEKFSIYEFHRKKSSGSLLSPLKVQLSPDETGVFFTSEDRAEIRLFCATISHKDHVIANPLTQGWSINAFHIPSAFTNYILITGSTINLSRRWMTLDTATMALIPIKDGTDKEIDLGINETKFESFEWPGADGVLVQAWLIKPRDFDSTKRYPLLYFIHGGPNSAINNEWATGYWRNWNFILLAEQGYVVVAPNASGSSGFGAEYAKRVLSDWGGKPYIDHEKGLEYLKTNFSFVDTENAIALGTSYGGFMINWIQGQPLGRQFKALVSECGIVNTSALYSSDLIWFEDHFGCPMDEDKRGYDKFNPLSHIKNWSTPTLFISNELDYRVPVVEGLAAFQILQARGIKSHLLSFPDEGHITTKPENRLHWWHTVLEWCSQYTMCQIDI